jgi:hypothetical protein
VEEEKKIENKKAEELRMGNKNKGITEAEKKMNYRGE